MSVAYRNFDIEATDYVREDGVERFRVRVLRSPVGLMSASEAVEVTIDAALQADLTTLERRTLQSRDFARLGAELADRLLPGRVREFFEKSLIELDGPDEGLRLRLRFDSAYLERHPWEYAYLAEPGDGDDAPVTRFLALNRKLSIVRCQGLHDEHVTAEPVAVDALQLCALFASPTGDETWLELAVDEEQRIIDGALHGVSGISATYFIDADSARLDEALELDPHVLHFAGHGDFDLDAVPPRGSLILRGVDGRGAALAADLLAARMRGRRTRFVVLGACFGGKRAARTPWSGVASSLLGVEIPAVVAMQYDLMDDSALAFARKVYTSLAAGKPLDAAIVDGRLEIVNSCGRDERDFGVPVLYIGAHDGPLFPRRSVAEGADDAETWTRLLAASQSQVHRQLARYRGTDATPGVYLPQAYLDRAHAQSALADFVGSDRRVMMLVDDAGMGKTSTLCRWAEQLSADGHLVFFYSADTSLHNGIAHDLSNDLALRTPAEVDAMLDRAATLSATRGKRLVLIVDALNDYRARSGGDAGDLLIELDALATRTAWPAMAVIGASSTAGWNRLSRAGVLQRVTRERWWTPEGTRLALQLGAFSRDECVAAWTAHARVFRLVSPFESLAPDLAARMRRPLLLRMVAEAWAGRTEPIAASDVTIDIFERFVTQRLTSTGEVALAERLAMQMWRARRMSLPLDQVLHDPAMKIEISRDGRATPWSVLQDRDIVRVEPGTALTGDTVTFVIPALGAFFLARALRLAGEDQATTVEALVADARAFPLGWPAARLTLLLAGDPALFARSAASGIAEVRELTTEALIEWHDASPEGARAVMQQLIGGDDSDARRAALKAAFYLGAATRDLLLRAAADPSEAVRDDVRDVLYLIWFTEETEVHAPTDATLVALWEERPGFAEAFLDDLLTRITLLEAAKGVVGKGELLSFFLAITMAIYINHCDRRDVIEKTIAWYKSLANDRLKLGAIDWIPGKARTIASKMVISVLYKRYGQQVVDALRLKDVEDGRDPFVAAPAERDVARRVIPALDPAEPLGRHGADLAAMFASDIPALRILAAIPVGVHACTNAAATITFVDGLRTSGTARTRLWTLLSFAVLAHDTPDAWIPALERWTVDLATQDRALLDGTTPSLLNALDVSLLPLGLALGKRARDLDVIETLIRTALASGDTALAARLVRALGVPGFYHAHPVLRLLGRCAPIFTDAATRGAMEQALGLVRAKHRSEVDTFILDASLGDDVARRVRTLVDPRLVRRLIWYVGLYSHGVYSALHYPRMRAAIIAPAFELVAGAPSAQAFALEYSTDAETLFWKSRFDLREWTRPEPWPA